ncbi:MAG: hypothetical protein RLZZ221_3047 [Verrucomicrobiota bacterium]
MPVRKFFNVRRLAKGLRRSPPQRGSTANRCVGNSAHHASGVPPPPSLNNPGWVGSWGRLALARVVLHLFAEVNLGVDMSIKASSSRVLSMLGGIGLLAGAVDPLEGSFVILAGSALLWGGEVMKVPERRQLGLWTSVFVRIAVGVGVMFGLSAAGGIGGGSGRSWWWSRWDGRSVMVVGFAAAALSGRLAAGSRRPARRTAPLFAPARRSATELIRSLPPGRRPRASRTKALLKAADFPARPGCNRIVLRSDWSLGREALPDRSARGQPRMDADGHG